MISHRKIYYRKIARGIYQLERDFAMQTRIRPMKTIAIKYITLTTRGRLTLKSGYVCDGPSGPTIDTLNSIRGGFIHDAGYRLMRRGLLKLAWRKLWDELIRDTCIEDGMYKWRAKTWYRVLRIAGKKNAQYDPKDCKVLKAP